jgi:diacylglycerol kinase (ATP)
MKAQPFSARLGFAVNGLRVAFRREKSLRVQAAAFALALVALIMARAAALWWALILLASAMVLVAELINTSLEILADHLHPQHHPAVGLAKDVAAGGVLVASAFALAVAAAWGVSLLVSTCY